MVIATGDIHGEVSRIREFAEKHVLTKDDILIILGDVGINYYLDRRDERNKAVLASLQPTIFCIHGNHEQRPQEIDGYKETKLNGGTVLYEERFPNILFPVDGEVFTFGGHHFLVIGGAYSVDKYYRLAHRYGWWANEQPSEETKKKVEQAIADHPEIDIVLSHTCPHKYEPIEMFLPMIDQSSVDKSTEIWLDKIEESVNYKAWYCGHWHTDKKTDKMFFMFKDFLEI